MSNLEEKRISAEEFDALFDEDKSDVLEYLDLSSAKVHFLVD